MRMRICRKVRVWYWVGLCCTLLGLTACGVPPGGELGMAQGVTVTRPALLSRQATALPIPAPARRATRTPFATATPEPTETPTRAAAHTLEGSPTLVSAAARKVDFVICSPLQNIALKDLPRLVSEPYHPPPMGSDGRHQGVDFAYYNWKDFGRIEGTLLQAVLGGWVAAALESTFPYGSLVILEVPGEMLPADFKEALNIPDGKSLYLLYAHMQQDSLVVEVGQAVEPCQAIGKVGKTGNTEAAHLHFEARTGPPGVQFAGMSYFTDEATKEEKRNYRWWRLSGDFLHFDPMDLFKYGANLMQTP